MTHSSGGRGHNGSKHDDDPVEPAPQPLFPDLEENPTELLHGSSSALLHRGTLSAAESDHFLQVLLDEVPWQQRSVRLFGNEVPQPRLVAWYGDPGKRYAYSGVELEPLPWSEAILALRERCERVAGRAFNSVLLNLYRDGDDSVAWHSDDEPELGEQPVIASLSLGAERRFDLRHRETGQTIRTRLPVGSLVVMSGDCQRDWSHQIAKTKKVRRPRINLTFRSVRG